MSSSPASDDETVWRGRFASRANNRAANAALGAGNSALFETSYSAAVALSANLPNTQDKAIFEATLNVVAKPKGNASNATV